MTGWDLCAPWDVEEYTVLYFSKYKFSYIRGNE